MMPWSTLALCRRPVARLMCSPSSTYCRRRMHSGDIYKELGYVAPFEASEAAAALEAINEASAKGVDAMRDIGMTKVMAENVAKHRRANDHRAKFDCIEQLLDVDKASWH